MVRDLLRLQASNDKSTLSWPTDLDDFRTDRFVRTPSLYVDPVLALDEEEAPFAVFDMLPEWEEGGEGERVVDGVLLHL